MAARASNPGYTPWQGWGMGGWQSWQRWLDLCECKATLIYEMSSRILELNQQVKVYFYYSSKKAQSLPSMVAQVSNPRP